MLFTLFCKVSVCQIQASLHLTFILYHFELISHICMKTDTLEYIIRRVLSRLTQDQQFSDIQIQSSNVLDVSQSTNGRDKGLSGRIYTTPLIFTGLLEIMIFLKNSGLRI